MAEIEIISLVDGIKEADRTYDVCALVIDGKCAYLDSETDLLVNEPRSKTSIDGFRKMYDQCATQINGPRSIKDANKCRHVGNGIYRFRKGSYRVYWFYGDGKIVICSHITAKRQQKMNPRDKKLALDLKKLYENLEND